MVMMMIAYNLLTVDIVDFSIDCIVDPAALIISQSTTCTSSIPYSLLFTSTVLNLISSTLISGLYFLLYLL